jgi:hypothetical protein
MWGGRVALFPGMSETKGDMVGRQGSLGRAGEDEPRPYGERARMNLAPTESGYGSFPGKMENRERRHLDNCFVGRV